MYRRYLKFLRVSIVACLVVHFFYVDMSANINRVNIPELTKELERGYRSRISLPLCDFDAEKAMKIEVNQTVPTWHELKQRFSMLRDGGYYRPASCRARDTLNIIIPYRNREEHLKLFLQHMHPFLQTHKLEYTIYVIEQEKGVIFKKGTLMNAGFKESAKQNRSQCYAFHDIDMLPFNISINYTCVRKSVSHPSYYVRQYDFKPNYGSYAGGVLIFHGDDFRRLNGFSNLYWGWGGEDDDMYRRLRKLKIPLTHPPSPLLRFESWTHAHKDAFLNRDDFVKRAVERMSKEGLNSAKYTILRRENRRLYTWILVSANQTDGSYRDLIPVHGAYSSNKTIREAMSRKYNKLP